MKLVQTGGNEGYELIDFGNGRKLERFGSQVLDRPMLGNRAEKAIPALWESAGLIYAGERMNAKGGKWRSALGEAESQLSPWECRIDGLKLEIIPQQTGQIGVFPEHWLQWDWFGRWISSRREQGLGVRILHLFAYTGATTLWLAKSGAEVTHVDAMRHAVDWGRGNALRSGLDHLPIRWIVEDARKYVARELRRDSRYDLVLLDPPSYGHGRKGEAWEIHRDLVPLMQDCWASLTENGYGVVLTSHSSMICAKELKMEMRAHCGRDLPIETQEFDAFLVDRSGRRLECGNGIRFVNHGK